MAPTPTPDRALFRQLVEEIAVKAKATLPDANGRVDKAVALVLSGDVELLPDGTARVFSQSNGITSYLVVNGHCECKDYERAPSQWCKHRIAHGIQVRAAARLPQAAVVPAPEPEPEHHAPVQGIPREHVGVAGVIGSFFTVVEVATIILYGHGMSDSLTLGKSMGVSARITWGFWPPSLRRQRRRA
jgi:hypothetical protein